MYLYSRPFGAASEDGGRLAASWGLGEPKPTAKQIYAGASRIRELTDRGFQNIFYDRNKVFVVSFWADSCRPCDAVATAVASVAQHFAQGRFAHLVKFYHAQWDPKVNPRLHQRYGFSRIPVVYFYYTSSGRQPSKAAPLLEAAAGGDTRQADSRAYIHNIETILRRHGHMAPTVAESRGWSHSRHLIESSDFADVDRLLIAPSPHQQYFADLYRANPQARFSRAARVEPRSSFNVHFQRINGSAPRADEMGTFDRVNRIAYLLAVRRLQVYLNSAVHEAVHFFACPMQGRFSSFFLNYGWALAEGFTQLVTEEILKSQKVTMSQAPYDNERALAARLVQVLGPQNVADDYFRCTRHVHTELQRAGAFGTLVVLRREAESATSEALRKQKYDEIIRLLDGLRGINRR